jgi:hypothetical protein
MKTIGFAGTFYTLWDVKVERIDVALGAWYDKVTCTYYQNLSKNLDEAIAKAGTDNVDETLRGKRKSFEYKKPLVVEPKIMTDCERLFWVLFRNDNAHLIDGVRQDAFNRCLELGYISEVKGEFEKHLEYEQHPKKDNVAYRFNHDFKSDDFWYSNTLNKFFIGII